MVEEQDPADWHTLDLAVFLLRSLTPGDRERTLAELDDDHVRQELQRALETMPEHANPGWARARINYRIGLPVFGSGSRLLNEYGATMNWTDDGYIYTYARLVEHFTPALTTRNESQVA